MTSLTAALTALFVLVYGALAVIALRRPLLARLALREAVRRPIQSAVAIAALMSASAALLAVNVALDSLDAAFTASAYQSWGRVDLVVGADGAFFDRGLAVRLAADPVLRERGATVQSGIELIGSVIDLDRDSLVPAVRLIGYDPATQPAFGEFSIASGSRTTDGVLLSRSLADTLDAAAGDRIRVLVGGKTAELQVSGIALAQGPGAYGLRPAVFLPNERFGALVPAGQINVVRVGVPGTGRDEIDRARELVPAVRTVLANGAPPAVAVKEVKADAVAAATQWSGDPRSILTSFAILIALAGAAMVINLMLAIADERRPRLAVLRALGLTRSGQVTLALLEGALYAVAAAVVGVIPGLLVGVFLIGPMRQGLTSAPVPLTTDDAFAVGPISVLSAITLGSLITIIGVAAGAIRGSRMTIANAVKDLPEPRRARGRRPVWRIATALLLVVIGAAILAVGGPSWRSFGGFPLIVAAIIATATRLPARTRAALLGAAVSAWALLGSLVFASDATDSTPGIMNMTIAVFGLAILSAGGLRMLEVLLGWLPTGGRLQATLRPPLAYLTRRPLRVGLGMAAIGLVLTVVVLFEILQSTSQGRVDQPGADWDLRVFAAGTASIPVPQPVAAQVTRQLPTVTRTFLGPAVRTSPGRIESGPDFLVTLHQLDDAQIAQQPVPVARREPRFADVDAVWAALRSDPTLVLSGFGYLGGDIALETASGTLKYHVIGSYSSDFLGGGLIGSERAMAPLSYLPAGATLLLKAAPGTDVRALARDLQRDLFAAGAQVQTIDEAMQQRLVTSRGIYAVSEPRVQGVVATPAR